MIKIYRTEDELSDKLIIDFINKYKKDNLERYKKLQKYYNGENDITSKEKVGEKEINNQISNNYAGYITDMATGYFIGNPVRYSSIDDEFLNEMQDIFNYNDEQDENNELSKQCSIKGRCYEIIYLDKNDLDESNMPRLRFNEIHAENMMVVYDYSLSAEIKYAFRWYEIESIGKKTEKIEVYTNDEIIFYAKDGSKLVEEYRVNHHFGIVPVVEFTNNNEKKGDFEKVISLIDGYDKSLSSAIDNLEYFADCYLYLVGMKETSLDSIEEMRKKRVLLLDEKGEAGFLVKDSNNQEIENTSERIKKDIHKFSLVPDLSDENFAGNSSGIAINYKLIGLEQLAVKKERKMKRAIQKRIEIITNYLNFIGRNYDFRDIQLKFTRNIPVNEKENVEIAKALKGLISDKSAIAYLKMVDDVNTEIENIEREKSEIPDIEKPLPNYEILKE